MLEHIISYINSMSPFWVYAALFFFSLSENIFPPSPSDVIVVFGATLISGGNHINFLPVLFITSLGSSLGFMLMYLAGKLFGDGILRSGKLKFVSQESLDKSHQWFIRYGYKLILVNRFLPGTRSVISFFAGIGSLGMNKTFLYATISAFAWNFIIIFMGYFLGNNIQLIDKYLTAYSQTALVITALVLLFFAARYFIIKSKSKTK